MRYFYYLLASQASSFLIYCLSQTQSIRPQLVASFSLRSPSVTYGTPCHAIAFQVLPTQPLPRESENFLKGDKYFNGVPNLLPIERYYYLVGYIYVLGTAAKYYLNLLLVLNSPYY